MTKDEVAAFIARYAATIGAPVKAETAVLSVEAARGSYRVVTNRGSWRPRAVVIATGACNEANVPPALLEALPPGITSFTAKTYRNPAQLDDGEALVVGASATGVQLAREIHASGRPVTLAVGEHVRMPRRYRGRDVQWWMDAAGVLDQLYTEVEDIARARRVPSPQLAGTAHGSTLDLNALRRAGVRIVGRLAGIDGSRALFSGSLANHCAMADLKLGRLLDTFDAWAVEQGIESLFPPRERPAPTAVDAAPGLSIDMKQSRIRTVVWATGLRPAYSWLELPVFDRRGRLAHDGGVLDAPGVYVLGLPFLRRRKSSYIHGAEDDARDLSAHLVSFLRGRPRASPVTPWRPVRTTTTPTSSSLPFA